MTNEQKQHLLACLGYYTGDVDGIWGEQSREATRALQKAAGLEEDGDFGDKTLAVALDRISKKQFAQPEESAPEPEAGEGTGYWKKIRYFTRNEAGIACPCGRCGGFPVEPEERLMLNADRTREHFGRAMIPSSTVRCPAHNAELPGSAANSLHKRGKAMDFAIPGIAADTIVSYIKTLPDVDEAYAIDGSYVHMGVMKY